MAEVFAGFLSYTDAQIGRILDYLEESGQLDDTIIVVISDNGASGEGGPNGSVNERQVLQRLHRHRRGEHAVLRRTRRARDLQPLSHRVGDGVQHAVQAVQALRLARGRYRRHRNHQLAQRNRRPRRGPGQLRQRLRRDADRLRTLGITPPDEVGGIPQKPLDGVSFKAALDEAGADTGKTTQFYTMLGTRGIWHDGWFANTVHAASPAGWSHFDDDRWELFHIDSDRSQCHDLAAEQPEKLEELKALWFAEAAKYNGLPLADLNIMETLADCGRTCRWTARPSPTTRARPRWAWGRRSNCAASRSRCWPRSP